MNARALVLGCLLVVSSVGPLYAQGSAPEPAPQAAQPPPAAKPPQAGPRDDARPQPERASGAITNEPPPAYRLIAPPLLRETRGEVRTTALFPVYFERRAGDDVERFVLPYYQRRSPSLDADVPLGVVWWLRGPQRNTFVLPPFYTHRDKQSWALGLAPLFATGVLGGHHHTIIPPLLTWIDGDKKNLRAFVGPYWRWKRGTSDRWGLFPLLWAGRDEAQGHTVLPPLYFHLWDDDEQQATTVVPPFYRKKRGDTTGWGLVPLVFRKQGPELTSTTVPLALFHHARGPDEFRLVLPGLVYRDHKREGRTWITPVYQRRRGDRNFDSVAPFFFHGWDERDQSSSLVIPPIFFRFSDPANDATVVFPFVGRWFHDGIDSTWVTPVVGRYKSFERDAQTWWVAPTFQYGWTEHSRTFNIHPLFYRYVSPEKRHLVLSPLYFDFENSEAKTRRRVVPPLYWDFHDGVKKKRSLVLFPLYWDFEDASKQRRRRVGFPLYWDFEDKLAQTRKQVAFPLYFHVERGAQKRTVALNTYFERTQDKQGKRWQFYFLPLFGMGKSDKGHWWNVLGGLAAYERRGKYRRAKVLFIPFELE